jgi:hypothetical protein
VSVSKYGKSEEDVRRGEAALIIARACRIKDFPPLNESLPSCSSVLLAVRSEVAATIHAAS